MEDEITVSMNIMKDIELDTNDNNRSKRYTAYFRLQIITDNLEVVMNMTE